MAEATVDAGEPAPDEAAALQELAREFDLARMRQIGAFHFALVMGVITLFGAGVTWAQVTDWGLAHVVSVANALVAAYVLHSTIHEWGHFLGARLSGAVSPVFEAPKRHFFLFDFPLDQNDTRQFLWMSWGGILAPCVTIVVLAVSLPWILPTAVLLATLVAKAIGTALFEVPVALRTRAGGEPGAELGKQTMAGALDRGRNIGALAGAAFFAVAWLAF